MIVKEELLGGFKVTWELKDVEEFQRVLIVHSIQNYTIKKRYTISVIITTKNKKVITLSKYTCATVLNLLYKMKHAYFFL